MKWTKPNQSRLTFENQWKIALNEYVGGKIRIEFSLVRNVEEMYHKWLCLQLYVKHYLGSFECGMFYAIVKSAPEMQGKVIKECDVSA